MRINAKILWLHHKRGGHSNYKYDEEDESEAELLYMNVKSSLPVDNNEMFKILNKLLCGKNIITYNIKYVGATPRNSCFRNSLVYAGMIEVLFRDAQLYEELVQKVDVELVYSSIWVVSGKKRLKVSGYKSSLHLSKRVASRVELGWGKAKKQKLIKIAPSDSRRSTVKSNPELTYIYLNQFSLTYFYGERSYPGAQEMSL